MKYHEDPRLHGMQSRLASRCKALRMLFRASKTFSENSKTIEMVAYLEDQYGKEFGPMSMTECLLSMAVQIFAWKEKKFSLLEGKMRQPPTCYAQYRMPTGIRLPIISSLFSKKQLGSPPVS